ncbi:MAG: hypothetical protein ACI9UA_005429, partial [Pseudoalteromonas tetraodonis]
NLAEHIPLVLMEHKIPIHNTAHAVVVGTKANGRQNGSSSRHTCILDICVGIASFFFDFLGRGSAI